MLQVRYRELHVAAIVKHTAVISPDGEQVLWDSKVVGDHDPLALQRAMFFYVGKTLFERWPIATWSQALPVYPLFKS